MIVVVTGGRNYDDEGLVYLVLDRINAETPITLLGHGACGWDADRPLYWKRWHLRGADRWAHEWARSRDVHYKPVPAAWSAIGGRAGPVRNALMLDLLKPELVVAFPGGAGTRGCVALARQRGIIVEHAARDAADARAALVADRRDNGAA